MKINLIFILFYHECFKKAMETIGNGKDFVKKQVEVEVAATLVSLNKRIHSEKRGEGLGDEEEDM